MLNKNVTEYIENNAKAARDLLLTLAPIPAPSHKEELRAEFCKKWLVDAGAENVYIDEALNVVYPVYDDGKRPLKVFMAHSDVVFPDTEPLPLYCRDGRIYCPGVGDDTANAVALLTVAKYVATHMPECGEYGVLLVINSCEEGLGNLKGCRKIMEDYGSRVAEFVTFDGGAQSILSKAVGSHRYRIEIKTKGGHSYGNFGSPNAIHLMSQLICRLYSVEVPKRGRTTFNVGVISGGTSVNTIAQNAEMLYEYRSDNKDDLAEMKGTFEAIIKEFSESCNVQVSLVGDRPCGTAHDEEKQADLVRRTVSAVEYGYGITPKQRSGSTDCNVPLSMGIPSVCVGCINGGGAHTREEYVEENSIKGGLYVAFSMILDAFGGTNEQ
ncbi:MAG: M20/M25/M40 family metallo-hydrolase [Clostridia bacterium]|nr:M20/M25/M40 family metallo-hydrolase [Clostridia bacterium]